MTASTSRQRLLFAGAVLVLAAGLGVNWAVGRGGVDFPSLYETGRAALTGANIYDASATAIFPERYNVARPMGMFYPPATGFVMLPFALLPFELARFAWLLTIDLTLIFGIRALIRFTAPQARNHVWMYVVGVVLLSSALRWGMMLLQGAPLVLGLLCWFVVALHGNRPRSAAAIAILAVAVKMTLSLPFLGLLLLRRRFGAALAGVATWAGLNAIGFFRMGSTALAQYRQNVGSLESFGNINAPDPWNGLSLPRLDWTYLFFGLGGNLAAAKLVSLILAGLVSLWLAREGLRTRLPSTLYSTALFLPPLVCLGSLCVYHHQYDACLFFAPVIVGYFVMGRRVQPRWAALLSLPLVVMILVLPIGLTQALADTVFGAWGVGLLKLSFPIAFTSALVGSLIMLRAGEPNDTRNDEGALDALQNVAADAAGSTRKNS